MEPAPFEHALSEGPADVVVGWTRAADGVRLRFGLWQVPDAKGTILLFTGRTEYLEKYGRVIKELTAQGYCVASIDWRGQGHSDRLMTDPRLGHVAHFRDYQLDVAALVSEVEAAGLPGPRFLIAHSMGGAIGLRALIDGLDVRRAVFSGPMWGIYAPKHIETVSLMLLAFATRLGQAHRLVPGTQVEGHVTATDFKDNKLTTDRESYDYITRQSKSVPAFSLGGPTFHWLGQALGEIETLHEDAKPEIPVRVFVGRADPIVHRKMIGALVESWPSATLDFLPGGKHELMIEMPELRNRFMRETVAFFDEAL